jgi:Flp pilus assembly protein TadG
VCIAAASLNFLLALGAMVDLAQVVNTSASMADAVRWNSTLRELRSAYARAYWSDATGSFAASAVELQTLNALAISAEVGGVHVGWVCPAPSWRGLSVRPDVMWSHGRSARAVMGCV